MPTKKKQPPGVALLDSWTQKVRRIAGEKPPPPPDILGKSVGGVPQQVTPNADVVNMDAIMSGRVKPPKPLPSMDHYDPDKLPAAPKDPQDDEMDAFFNKLLDFYDPKGSYVQNQLQTTTNASNRQASLHGVSGPLAATNATQMEENARQMAAQAHTSIASQYEQAKMKHQYDIASLNQQDRQFQAGLAAQQRAQQGSSSQGWGTLIGGGVGAVGGGILGSVIPGLGTAVGAGLGATLGGALGGGIGGMVGGNSYNSSPYQSQSLGSRRGGYGGSGSGY